MKLMILPDSHCHYNYSNERFTALGRVIVEERPDVLINLGDFADMSSLSSFDDGHTSFEGRRYHKDLEAVVDAQEKLFQPVKDYNRRTHRAYRPRLELCLGNHEYRIIRATEEDPKLDGTISIQDLQYEKFGWTVHPFLESVTVGGITFSHYFISGVASRPISGESIGRTLCAKLHGSAVVGHNHTLDHAERTSISGNKIFGLSAGCYVHENFIEDWCRQSVKLWWRGIIILNDLDGNGYYDEIKMLTLRKILREYL